MELHPVVDENDKVIGYKPRAQMTSSDIYRVASLMVLDGSGNILLGRRAKTKKNNPGKLSPLVNGTVAKGESYDETIRRETVEEIGFLPADLAKLKKVRVRTKEHNFFIMMYKCKVDSRSQLRTDPQEISEVVQFPVKEVSKHLKKNPADFVPEFGHIYSPIASLLL